MSDFLLSVCMKKMGREWGGSPARRSLQQNRRSGSGIQQEKAKKCQYDFVLTPFRRRTEISVFHAGYNRLSMLFDKIKHSLLIQRLNHFLNKQNIKFKEKSIYYKSKLNTWKIFNSF